MINSRGTGPDSGAPASRRGCSDESLTHTRRLLPWRSCVCQRCHRVTSSLGTLNGFVVNFQQRKEVPACSSYFTPWGNISVVLSKMESGSTRPGDGAGPQDWGLCVAGRETVPKGLRKREQRCPKLAEDAQVAEKASLATTVKGSPHFLPAPRGSSWWTGRHPLLAQSMWVALKQHRFPSVLTSFLKRFNPPTPSWNSSVK